MNKSALLLMMAGLVIIIGIIYLLQHLQIPGSIGSTLGAKTTVSLPPPIGRRTKTIGCTAHDALPDAACTPGAIIVGATKEQICVSGYSKSVRSVSRGLKDEVYAEYGITSHHTGEYEVDHHVSLELGGSNDIANLWPEPAEPRPGFHEKDMVENYLHDEVCAGALSLDAAQRLIADDWRQVYALIK